MNYASRCLWLVASLSIFGYHWRGERPPQAEPKSNSSTEQESKPRSAYSETFTAYEKSIIQTLNEQKISFAIEENPRLQAGMAKFLLAKIIRSDSGLIIVIGTPTDWEGFIPPSGTEFQKNGKPVGIQVNNYARQDASESIHCYFTYGNIDDATKAALLKTVRRIE